MYFFYFVIQYGRQAFAIWMSQDWLQTIIKDQEG